MTTIALKDANGTTVYVSVVSGTGTSGDPYIIGHQVTNFPATQPVSATALPLPTGAATAANQTTAQTSLGSIDTKLTGVALDGIDGTGITQPTGGVGIRGWLSGIYQTLLNRLPTLVSGRVPTDGSGVTQPVSGSVSVGNFPATQPISAAALPLPTGASQEHTTAGSPAAARLTDGTSFYKPTTPSDTQPVSATSLPLPTGAATAANQTAANSSLSSLDTKTATAQTLDYDTGAGVQTMPLHGVALPASGGAVAGGTSSNPFRNDPTGTTIQPVSGSVSVGNFPSDPTTGTAQTTTNTEIGGLTDTAPSTDTGSASINARLQRVAQRLTSLIALVPSALTGSGNFKVAIVENTANTDPATGTNQSTQITDLGSVTETAPASDIASAGLNGRLQRVAQRLTSLIALFPSALTGSGNFKVALSESTATVTVTQSGVITAGGTTVRASSSSMTRPADTTAYAAGDGVTTATSSASGMTVPNIARVSGGSGVLIEGRATKSTTSTTNALFRLWFYQNSASVTIPSDNAAFTPAAVADRAKLIGYATVDFSGGVVGSDGVTAPIVLSSPQLPFKCTGTDLLVIWEARLAYTPGNAEVFYLEIGTAQD